MVQKLVGKIGINVVTWLATSILAVTALAGSIVFAADESRTVIDNPRGGCYIYPYGSPDNPEWSEYGVYFGMPNVPFEQMRSDALKGVQGRLHFHGLETTTDGSNPDFYLFPSIKAHAFEADEIRKGRKPFWWTATYQGKSRPVVDNLLWSPFGCKSQGLNLADDRFIKFFIHDYERGIIMRPGMSQWVTGLDGCFDWTYQTVPYYGLFDDSGAYHRLQEIGVTHLDKPFPQSDAECLEGLAYCMGKLNECAPDLKLVLNGASLRESIYDWPLYDRIFSNIYGVLMEDFCHGSRSWNDVGWSYMFHNLNFERNLRPSTINKVQVFHVRNCEIPENLRDAYCAHLICSGPNRFFGPMGPDFVEIAPAAYADMKNALGEPVKAPDATSLDDTKYHWLYSRETQGGWVYFNNSFKSQKVTPPGEATWYDRDGNKVKEVTLPAGAGDYIKNIPGQRCAAVMINPRYAETITGPITVTLSTEPWTTGSTIRYTTDGSKPGAKSPVYTGPFTIDRSCTVKAYATKPGLAQSFTSAARYNITSTIPQVSFHLAEDGMSQFLDYYPLVKLDHPSSKPISIQYAVIGGTAIRGTHYDLYNGTDNRILAVEHSGTLTIPAGDMYAHFHIKVKNGTVTGGDKTINISLKSPINAKLGTGSTFTYTIQE